MITKDLFIKALANSKAVRPQDMELLNAWSALPERALTADKVVEITGAKRASLIINNLGKRIAAFLEVEPEAGNAASIIALEGSVADEAAWIMRAELAEAMGKDTAEQAPAETVEAVEEVVAKPVEVTEETSAEYEEAEEGSLKAQLIEFEKTVIRAAYPNTQVENRLLSPAMVNALVSTLPANKSIYQREIPSSLRSQVNPQEAKRFLNKVLNILKKKSA